MITRTITEYEQSDYDEFRDNLTNEEAADILEYIKRGYIPDYNFTRDKDDFERYKMHMAMRRAIDVLKNEVDKNEA